MRYLLNVKRALDIPYSHLTCVVEKQLVNFGFIFSSKLYLVRLICFGQVKPNKRRKNADDLTVRDTKRIP